MVKLCPLAKDKCIEENCAWYTQKAEQCSIRLLAINLDLIRRKIQGKQNEN